MRVDRLSGYTSPWLSATDLQGRTVKVRIESVTARRMRNFEGVEEERVIVEFAGASKSLVLNRSQCRALAEFAGYETDNWVGQTVLLSPAPSRQPGKQTIVLTAPLQETAPKPAGEGRNGAQAAASGRSALSGEAPSDDDGHWDSLEPPAFDDEIPF